MRINVFNTVSLVGLTLLLAGCGIDSSPSAAVSKMVAAKTGKSASDRAVNVKLDVVGICVIKPDPENKYGGSCVPGQHPGTSIHLRISDKSQNFISINNDSNVQLTASGKTLTQNEPTNFGFMTQFSDDGHSCTIPIHGEQLPPARSSALHVKGTVGLVAGSDLTTDQLVFDLKKGSEFKLGGIPVEISELDEPWSDEYAIQVHFQAKQSFDCIRRIEFFDEKDQPIESTPSGTTSFGFGDNYTYTVAYSLKRQPVKLTAKTTYFKTTKDIEIPVDFQVGLGVGGP